MLTAVNCSVSHLDYISNVEERLLAKWQQHWNVQPNNALSSGMFYAVTVAHPISSHILKQVSPNLTFSLRWQIKSYM